METVNLPRFHILVSKYMTFSEVLTPREVGKIDPVLRGIALVFLESRRLTLRNSSRHLGGRETFALALFNISDIFRAWQLKVSSEFHMVWSPLSPSPPPINT